MNQLYNAFTLFFSLLVEAMPFLLLGVLLSSALLSLMDERQLIAKLPRNPILGAIIGSCIGFAFPVCECGNVPVARRLILQGVPTSLAVGFLLAAPTINPIVIWSTSVAFPDRPEIVLLRILFSLAIAIIIGSIFSVQKDPRPLLQSMLARRLNTSISCPSPRVTQEKGKEPLPALLQSGTFLLSGEGSPVAMTETLARTPVQQQVLPNKLVQFLENIALELRELGGMLVLGSAIAAGIQVFVPRELILSLGQGTMGSILAMMVLAALVSICSTVDSFFVLSFASTFTTGSLLAFLVFGPIIDIKSVGLMLSIFRPRIIFYFFALAAQLTFIFALGYSYFG